MLSFCIIFVFETEIRGYIHDNQRRYKTGLRGHAAGESFYIPPTQYGVSVAMLPMQKRYNEFIKSNREPTAKPLLYLRTVKRKWNIMFRKYPKRRGNSLDVAVKPLTLIYPGARNLATNLLADDGSIAIRITKNRSHNDCADSSEKLSYRPRPISAGMRLPITFPKYRTK